VRSLGLDMGEKRIGVALSDPQDIIASPLTTIARDEEGSVVATILKLAQHHQAGRIVVGLPLSLSGDLGKEALKVQAFVHQLSKQVSIPVETWDERLSTVSVERLMRETSRKRHGGKANRDAMAAAIILQGYLDRLQASSHDTYNGEAGLITGIG